VKKNLLSIQRAFATAIMRPLTPGGRMQARWTDGKPARRVAAKFIKPNDRLTSFERLELYNRMYWYRLLDAIRDDCPGLLAALGEAAFSRLAQAYLAERPSQSFTLRNLCSRLEAFIREHPRLTAPRTTLAAEIARFEWAQTVAFDGESRPVVAAASLARTPPERLRLGLQPYVTLLALRYPVDAYVMSVKRRDAMRSEASNTPDSNVVHRRTARRSRLPRPSRTFLAVHRLDNRLYYKRLEPEAFRILGALALGATLARAVAAGGRAATPAKVKGWFTTWMALGWFCAPGNKRRARAS